MDEKFDPYHRWLGIPPNQQPPDHYRLLGLDRLENDPDVIESAADRQMSHLRTFQTGPYAHLSQKLLNEVAAAKVCLLNAKKKAAYDKLLGGKSKLVKAEAIKEGATAESKAIDIESLVGGAAAVRTAPGHAKARPARKATPNIAGPVLAVGAMLAAAIAVAAIAWATRRPSDETAGAKTGPTSASDSGKTPPPYRNKAAPAEKKDASTKPEAIQQAGARPADSSAAVKGPKELPAHDSAAPSDQDSDLELPLTKAAHAEKPEDLSPQKSHDAKGPPLDSKVKSAPPQELHRTWKTKDGAAPIAADLVKVEQDMVVLKKLDGNSVRILYEQLIESDQEDASRWVISEATKIWNPEDAALQTGRGGANAQNYEREKATSLNKALQDAFVKETLTVVDVSVRPRGASSAKLTVQTAGGVKRNLILPVLESVAMEITVPSRLVVDGRLSYKFGNCPLCDGFGKLKCPHCSRGKVSHLESKTVRFPNGDKVVQQVPVFETCGFCHGTGRLDACKHVYPSDWEPFGSRKLPDGAYSFLTASGGARRVYIMLNDVQLRIYTPTKLLSFRRDKGKLVTESEALAKASTQSISKPQ